MWTPPRQPFLQTQPYVLGATFISERLQGIFLMNKHRRTFASIDLTWTEPRIRKFVLEYKLIQCSSAKWRSRPWEFKLGMICSCWHSNLQVEYVPQVPFVAMYLAKLTDIQNKNWELHPVRLSIFINTLTIPNPSTSATAYMDSVVRRTALVNWSCFSWDQTYHNNQSPPLKAVGGFTVFWDGCN